MIDTKSTGIRISEMAIRGQLSKRVKPLISTDDIVENIKTERDSLIKEKATKISKVSDMLEDEIFDIPDGWKWVALGDLCILLSRGKSPKYSEVKKYPVFAQKCNQPNCLALEKALFLDETTLYKWPEYFRLREADVVINSTGTGTVGRVGYYTTETLDSNYEFMLPDSHVTVVRTGKNVSSRYIYYALRTATLQSIMEKTFRGSTNQKEFYIDSVYSIPIPLPPVEEQEEIVKTLDEVFEQLKIIDKLQAKYNNDLAVLKSKIIDAGIRGKLTEQFPEDGDAETLYSQILEEKEKLIKEGKIKKEKALPEIVAEEIPFEIPKNWKWVRFGELYSLTNGIASRGTPGGKAHPVLRLADLIEGEIGTENIRDIELSDSEFNRHKICNGDIVFIRVNGSRDKVANAFLYHGDDEISYCDHLFAGKKISEDVDSSFIMHLYSSPMVKKQVDPEIKTTAGQNTINQGSMAKILIPLPPAPEQKRIVKRVEDILQIVGT